MSLVGTLNSGVSALKTFSQSIQVTANNIANVNTTGFKGSRAEYSDNFSDILQRATPSAASGVGSNQSSTAIGTGAQSAASNSVTPQVPTAPDAPTATSARPSSACLVRA